MRRLVALVLAAGLLLGSAATVAADDENLAFIDPVFCAQAAGGSLEVHPGDSVIAVFGWGSKSLGQEKAFLDSAQITLSVDGNQVDITPYQIEIRGDTPPKFSIVFWNVPVGSLAEGQSLTITFDEVLKQPIYDGFFHYPRGSLVGGPVTCVVTAVAPT